MSVSTDKKAQRTRRLERGAVWFAAAASTILLIVIGFLWFLFAMDTLGIPRDFAFIQNIKKRLPEMIYASIWEVLFIAYTIRLVIRDRKARREELENAPSDSADRECEEFEEKDS